MRPLEAKEEPTPASPTFRHSWCCACEGEGGDECSNQSCVSPRTPTRVKGFETTTAAKLHLARCSKDPRPPVFFCRLSIFLLTPAPLVLAYQGTMFVVSLRSALLGLQWREQRTMGGRMRCVGGEKTDSPISLRTTGFQAVVVVVHRSCPLRRRNRPVVSCLAVSRLLFGWMLSSPGFVSCDDAGGSALDFREGPAARRFGFSGGALSSSLPLFLSSSLPLSSLHGKHDAKPAARSYLLFFLEIGREIHAASAKCFLLVQSRTLCMLLVVRFKGFSLLCWFESKECRCNTWRVRPPGAALGHPRSFSPAN